MSRSEVKIKNLTKCMQCIELFNIIIFTICFHGVGCMRLIVITAKSKRLEFVGDKGTNHECVYITGKNFGSDPTERSFLQKY